MKNILLVCTGNTCRSSMAEGILKYLLEEYKDYEFQVRSAGTSVFYSEPANEKAFKVMEEMGIDIGMHMSQPVNEILISEADIILTMTYNHKENLLRSFPESQQKVFTLKEYLNYLFNQQYNIMDTNHLLENSELDIIDPYGQNLEEYRRTALEINDTLKKIVELLIREQ